MRTDRLGCLSGTGILAAILTAFIIAGYAYASGGLMYSPGPLNAQAGETLGGVNSHAATSGNCQACHVPPWDSAHMDDRCIGCHTGTIAELRDTNSMHGRMLQNNPQLTCRECHLEHRGAAASLTVITGKEFPHETVGYSLNAHQITAAQTPFTCDDCHQGDISVFASDACQACHRQISQTFALAHTLEYGDDCLACHDGVDRFDENFRHAFDFRLTGKHAAITCANCHTGARALADFTTLNSTCASCHRKDEPHEGRFGADCTACHTVEGWKPATFDHALSAFKLEGKHAKTQCEDCHANGSYAGTPTDCFACHQKDDEHAGKFGADCAACHQPSNWEDVTFDHNKSNFPLTGQHAGLACEQCHTDQQFAGLSTACVTCHTDPAYHAGLFSTDCASCHTTNNWLATYTGSHPGIADEGGSGVNHGNTNCRTCHTQNLRSATCLACHENNNPEGEGGGD
jgi:hypothetical protein